MPDKATAGGDRVAVAVSGDPWERAENVTCVVCPGCAFTFDAAHTSGLESEVLYYTCPNCSEDQLMRRAAWAEQQQRLLHKILREHGVDLPAPMSWGGETLRETSRPGGLRSESLAVPAPSAREIAREDIRYVLSWLRQSGAPELIVGVQERALWLTDGQSATPAAERKTGARG